MNFTDFAFFVDDLGYPCLVGGPACERREIQMELRGISRIVLFVFGEIPKVHFMEDQVGEEGNDGGCLIREAQQKKVLFILLVKQTPA